MASPRRNISRALFAALAACALWLAAVAPVHAQPQAPSKPRPKVALVLSGGGAMGIAHVGAILELERLGIRPDMVVGASMGSIVGGLYASGMTGDQLTHAVETMDWDAIFDTSPSRDGLTFRQKEQQADFPVKASLGVAHGRLRAPDALISDANLLLQLRQLVGVRGAVADFDQLPIPFRAVATDIETGHRVVIDHGELAGAMRASMSVPGVFAPYQLEGKLLVDGGMADNVPVDVAREMGADIVIVVATQTPMAKGAEVRSLPQVLGQTVTMLILANERQQLATLKPSDILISVHTGGLSAADFKKGAALIAAGRASARTQEAALGRLAEQRGFTAPAPVTRPAPVVGYVRVENDSRIDNEILLRHIQPFVGRPLDTQAVVAALQQIYAIGVFTRVDFTVESRDGQTGVVVHAQQKPGDENQLRAGLTIAAAGKGHSEFDLSLDYRLLQLDSHGSEARFVGVIGDRKEISAEYFKVIDSRQRWFVLPKIDLFRRPIAVYDSSGFRLGEYDVGAAVASLAAGRQFGGFGEVRLGIQAGRGEANVQEGQLLQPHLNLDVGQLFARAAADTLDNPYFPTRGVKGSLEWTGGYTALGDVADFQTVTARGLYTASFSRRDTVILNFEAGDTVSGTLPVSSLYTLGGAFNFPGFATDELTGDAYMVARAIYRRRLSDNSQSLFGVPLFAGATLAAGNTWVGHGIETSHMRVGANVYLAADTVIGPVFLALGAAEGGRTGIYVFVGRPF